jgi:hypothetical protein
MAPCHQLQKLNSFHQQVGATRRCRVTGGFLVPAAEGEPGGESEAESLRRALPKK